MTRQLLYPTSATTNIVQPGQPATLVVPTGITFVGASPWLDEGTDSYLEWPASDQADFGEISGVVLDYPGFSADGLAQINLRAVFQGLPDDGGGIPGQDLAYAVDLGVGEGEANFLAGADLYGVASGTTGNSNGSFHYLGRVEDDWSEGSANYYWSTFDASLGLDPSDGLKVTVWFNGFNFSYNGPLKLASLGIEVLYDGDVGPVFAPGGRGLLVVSNWEANVSIVDVTGYATVLSGGMGGVTNDLGEMSWIGWDNGRVAIAASDVPLLVLSADHQQIAGVGETSSWDWQADVFGDMSSISNKASNTALTVAIRYPNGGTEAGRMTLLEYNSSAGLLREWDMGPEDGPYWPMPSMGTVLGTQLFLGGGWGGNVDDSNHGADDLWVFDLAGTSDMVRLTAADHEVVAFMDTNNAFLWGMDNDGTNLYLMVYDDEVLPVSGKYTAEFQVFKCDVNGTILARYRFWCTPQEGTLFRPGGFAVDSATGDLYVCGVWTGQAFGTATGNNEYDGPFKIAAAELSDGVEVALNVETHGFYGLFRFGVGTYLNMCLRTGIPPLRHRQRNDGAGVSEGHARMHRQAGKNTASSLQYGKRVLKNTFRGYR